MGFDSYTTSPQQLYNTSSHGGGPHTLGPTHMWGDVVQLLWWCCKSISFQNKNKCLSTSVVVRLLWKMSAKIISHIILIDKNYCQFSQQPLLCLLFIDLNVKILVYGIFFFFLRKRKTFHWDQIALQQQSPQRWSIIRLPRCTNISIQYRQLLLNKPSQQNDASALTYTFTWIGSRSHILSDCQWLD
jgi:hypothetical protein